MDKSRREELTPREQQIWDSEGTTMGFEIARERVQTGLTFSAKAFDEYLASIAAYIGSRVVKHWEETGEPPTIMRTVVSVSIDHGPVDKAQERMDERPDRVLLRTLRSLLEIHAAVQMDTPEDKALHAKAVQQFQDIIDELEKRVP